VRQLGHGRPPDMGKGGENLPSRNVVKCFFVLHMFSKVSKYLCIIWRNVSFWGSAPGPRWGTFGLETPSLPTPGKNPAGSRELGNN